MMTDDVLEMMKTGVQALSILTIIPIVAFALWLDYFDRKVDAQLTVNEFNLEASLRTLHVAFLWTFMLEILLFAAARPIRIHYPFYTLTLFLGAIAVHALIMLRADKKLRSAIPTSEAHRGIAGRAALWISAAVFGHLTLLSLFIVPGYYSLQLASTKPVIGLLAIFASLVGGLCAGFLFTFSVAPLLIRKVFQPKELTTGPAFDIIQECFKRAHVKAIAVMIIDEPDKRRYQATIAGLSFMPGPLAPSLFISQGLIDMTSERQLRAIILHEVSHLALKHFRSRLIYGAGIIAATLCILAIALGLAVAYLPPFFVGIVQITSIVAILVLPIRLMKQQILLQEFQADEYATFKLSAGLEAMESALTLVSKLNEIPLAIRAGAHPSTNERIAVLTAIENQLNKVHTIDEDKNSDIKRAA